ncbi:MAG: aminopeptidase P family protein [Lachnospiraceae bacterium]|nr:aminopeptidase P family protein [Lachnospiraceae bacterium]
MFEQRREKLSETDEYDAIMIDSPENLYYYTGFTGGEAMLIMFSQKILKNRGIDDNVAFIITDSRYYEQVEKECHDICLIRLDDCTYVDAVKLLLTGKLEEIDKVYDKLSDVFSNNAHNYKIAIEDTMKLSRYLKLNESLGNCKLTIDSELINAPRMVKEEGEIALLKRAEQIGDEAFAHILTVLKPGITEAEIALELEFFMKKQGAAKLSFDTIVASGSNSSMPHAQVTGRVIENGDFVTMDFGCVYKGYCSDMTRTVAVGKPTDEMKKVYQIVLDANLRAMDGIKAGVKCSDIDELARGYIREKGYGKCFGHGLGHGVGLYIHEEPRFSPKCDVITRENMVITDEPGIYLPGRFGVRIEDLVVVKKNGCERLSNSIKELVIL